MMKTTAEEISKRLQSRNLAAERQRQLLQAKLAQSAPPALGAEAFEAHFAHMPLRYWLRVDEEAVRWHLGILQGFYTSLGEDGYESLAPVVRSRHFPERGFTEVVICTWDRLGLLANIAGAFAEADLNIVRADIYTRCDNVVLDIFHVCVGEYGHVADTRRLQETELLLAGLCRPSSALALLAGVPRLTPLLPGSAEHAELPAVRWDNEMSDEYSVLYLEAVDGVGLLFHVFRLLSQYDLSVAQAVITTVDGLAGDVFFVTAKHGGKLDDLAVQAEVVQQLRGLLRPSPN